jgi:hypothetical protein
MVHRLTRVWTNLGWVLGIDVEVLQQDGLGEGRPVVDPVHIKYWRIRRLAPNLNLLIYYYLWLLWFWILIFFIAKQKNSFFRENQLEWWNRQGCPEKHNIERAFQGPGRLFFIHLTSFYIIYSPRVRFLIYNGPRYEDLKPKKNWKFFL